MVEDEHAELVGTRKRLRPDAERIAKRACEFEDAPPQAEGVMPLNAGFFQHQRMRELAGAKVRAKTRGKAASR